MNPNIYYISDMPFSLGFGGKEVQLLGYKSIVDSTCPQYKIKLLDPWDRFIFPKNSILHLFGSGKWFHNLLGQAKQKSEIRKIIISPTFYYDSAWKLKVGNFLSRLTPFEDQFSYKRYIFGAADTLVVNSHAEGLQIASVFGEKLKNKMLVIPNTIDDNYTVINDEDSFLSKYQLSPGYVLSVGFWDERKNSLRMVQSFLQSFRHINRKLVLIGGGRFVNKRNGELMNKLLSENASSIVHIPFISNGSDILKSAYKNCAFHLLPSFGLRTVVFRHSSMYGGRQFATYDQGWIGWFCQKAVEAKLGFATTFTISGTGKQVRDVLHADDMIALYFSVLKHIDASAGQAFNIGGGMENSLSLLELFAMLERFAATPLQFEEIAARQSDQRVFVANLEKAMRTFDWTPKVSAEAGVRRMMDWVEGSTK